MTQCTCGSGFPLEASQPVGVRDKVRRKELDRDLSPQPRIPGTKHPPHAPLAEESNDLVGTESVARRDRRRRASYPSDRGLVHAGEVPLLRLLTDQDPVPELWRPLAARPRLAQYNPALI